MKKFSESAAIKRRAAPQIYVMPEHKGRVTDMRDLCRAHLRNKKGYIYLQWRDSEEIRSFYLGKAPRKSPTKRLRTSSPAPAIGRTRPGAIGGRKRRGVVG